MPGLSKRRSPSRKVRPRRARFISASLLAAALGLVSAWLLGPPRALANYDAYCYAVGDQSHELIRIDKWDPGPLTNEVVIGSTGTIKTDAITLRPGTGQLYGVDTRMTQQTGRIGVFNLETGAFVPRANALGTGSGALGNVTFYDLSGMAFDMTSGVLYAVHVRTGSGAADVLLQVDPNGGTHVPNAFGNNVDYVPVGPHPDFPHLADIDDIAIDPTDNTLYGIINNSSNGDRLIKINKQTGAITDVGAFGIGEVEGLDFDALGRLWATAGGQSGTEANKLYEVNKNTGAASNPRPLERSYNYEALACLTLGPDLQVSLSDYDVEASAGNVLYYGVQFANVGTEALSGVRLIETLPAYTTFEAAASTPGWPQESANTFVYNVGALGVGASGSVLFAVRVDPSLPGSVNELANSVRIEDDGSNGSDLNPANNGAETLTPVGDGPPPPSPPPGTPIGPLDNHLYLPLVGR